MTFSHIQVLGHRHCWWLFFSFPHEYRRKDFKRCLVSIVKNFKNFLALTIRTKAFSSIYSLFQHEVDLVLEQRVHSSNTVK